MAKIPKDIPNFPGYRVGDDGSVWSETRGRLVQLKSTADWKGYLKVTLCRDGKHFTKKVHRLILETFVGPCPVGMEACHENGVRSDCRIENLRWGTSESNQSDRKRHGTIPIGSLVAGSKLNESLVLEIKRKLRAGVSQSHVARVFGVSHTAINHIAKERSWAWLKEAA